VAEEDNLSLGSSAEVHILFNGYIRREPSNHVASTVSFVRDGDTLVIIDPGMIPGPEVMLEPLAALNLRPEAITDVVFSHHHPDHTLNAALFPNARFHDHWAIYQGDNWYSRKAEGFSLSPSIRLIETPGHTPQDITTLAGTKEGIVAFTHLWWWATHPVEDPYSTDPALLHANRARVLKIASRIVPGHGIPFTPDETTPR
jgi:glyoxylase-like metal-dependent hydrolase (beta-lactamase superfamily II)